MIPTRSPRPHFLNPMRIQMPVGALASIGHRHQRHRARGGVPVGVYLLGLSLQDEQALRKCRACSRTSLFKGALVLLVWALAHHVLAGVRHLLTDFDIGSPLSLARRSAWLVNLGGVAVALLAAVVLL